jgi:hypothetical protein
MSPVSANMTLVPSELGADTGPTLKSTLRVESFARGEVVYSLEEISVEKVRALSLHLRAQGRREWRRTREVSHESLEVADRTCSSLILAMTSCGNPRISSSILEREAGVVYDSQVSHFELGKNGPVGRHSDKSDVDGRPSARRKAGAS